MFPNYWWQRNPLKGSFMRRCAVRFRACGITWVITVWVLLPGDYHFLSEFISFSRNESLHNSQGVLISCVGYLLRAQEITGHRVNATGHRGPVLTSGQKGQSSSTGDPKMPTQENHASYRTTFSTVCLHVSPLRAVSPFFPDLLKTASSSQEWVFTFYSMLLILNYNMNNSISKHELFSCSLSIHPAFIRSGVAEQLLNMRQYIKLVFGTPRQ